MKTEHILMIAGALIVGLFVASHNQRPDYGPFPPAPGFQAVFAQAMRADSKRTRADAGRAADLFRGLRAALEIDESLASPRLDHDSKIVDARTLSVSYWLGKAFRFNEVYPGFGEAVKQTLNAHGLTEAETITPERRKKWIAGYADLEAECRAVQLGGG